MARQTVWVEPPWLQASTAARVQVVPTLEARLAQEVEPRPEVVKTALGMRDTGAGTDLNGGQHTGSAIDREQMASAVGNQARSDSQPSKR